MIFCTPWFLVFSLVAAVLYVVVRPSRPARLVLMLVASVAFYLHFSGVAGFLVMGALAAFTYFAALRIHRRRSDEGSSGGWRLALWLAPAILALLYFRYYGFLTSTVLSGLSAVGIAPSAGIAAVIGGAAPALVPLGISFFAFEFCHYLTDVWKRNPPIRNQLHFAIFALFYPRLASGPIVRYQQIVPQLEKLPQTDSDDVAYAFYRIFSGFTKKFLLADPAAMLVESRFQPDQILYGSDVLWLCLLLYIRIYMDFGGYCDMAIGLARLWGIRLPENFRFPFIATSPSSFWKRWHITLSTWIRDYIYIPLGGGRVPAWRKAFNLLFAMALCGLWHGSAWNFVLWGAVHGVALQIGHGVTAVSARIAGTLSGGAAKPFHIARTGLGWVTTQIFVGFTWILFFYSAEDTVRILKTLARWQ